MSRDKWRFEPIDNYLSYDLAGWSFNDLVREWIDDDSPDYQKMRDDCEFFIALSPYMKPGVTLAKWFSKDGQAHLGWLAQGYFPVDLDDCTAAPQLIRETSEFAAELRSYLDAIDIGEIPSRSQRELAVWQVLIKPQYASIRDKYWPRCPIDDLRIPCVQPK